MYSSQQATRVYDYMIRAGDMQCNFAGNNTLHLPISIGVKPEVKLNEIVAHCELSTENQGLRIKVNLYNNTGFPVNITWLNLQTTISLPTDTDFFCNGYQSRSVSGLSKIDNFPKAYPRFCSRKKRNLGDYDFTRYSSRTAHSWTYTYFNSHLGFCFIGSLDESKAYTKFLYGKNESRDSINLSIEKDSEGFICPFVSKLAGGGVDEPYTILDVFLTTGKENDCVSNFFKVFYAANSDRGLRNRSKPALAWSSDYSTFPIPDEEKIESVAREYQAMNLPLDYFIIGSGYENVHGDWLETDISFPSGIKKTFDYISASGYKPGITFSPFVCSSSSRIFKERRELFLKDSKGKPIHIWQTRPFGKKIHVLDIYNNESQQYIKRCVETIINLWGAKIIKADLLYAAAFCGGDSHKRTRAQAMDYALSLLREYAGEIPVIASTLPLGSAFGRFEYCSIAPTQSWQWNPRNFLFCEKMLRERSGTKNSIKTGIARRHLDSLAFSADPGPYTLRKFKTGLSTQEQLCLFRTSRIFSGIFTASDNPGAYNVKSMQLLTESYLNRPIHKEDKRVTGISQDQDGIEISYCLNGKERKEKITLIRDLYLN